jgi:hypothetical protein
MPVVERYATEQQPRNNEVGDAEQTPKMLVAPDMRYAVMRQHVQYKMRCYRSWNGDGQGQKYTCKTAYRGVVKADHGCA